MPNPTPCTKCGRESDTRFCPHCGANQSHRCPEAELADQHCDSYIKWKRAVDNLPADEEDRDRVLRITARYEGSKRRLLALHALCDDAGRPFALPADMQADDKPEATEEA